MTLTNPQKNALAKVVKAGPNGLRSGCTNSTLCALERRGLVICRFLPSPYNANVRVNMWFTTATGMQT